MTYFSDKAIAAAVEAMKPDRIQGFTYGTENVIRDVYRPWDAQVLWRAPVGDDDAFHRQCEIERLRIGLVAAAKVHDEERDNPLIASLDMSGGCFCRAGKETSCRAINCPRSSPSPAQASGSRKTESDR